MRRIQSRTEGILRAVAGRHDIPVELMVKRRRTSGLQMAELVAARREAMVLLSRAGQSHSSIARQLGLHHTTVLHHLRDEPKSRIKEGWRPDESGIWAI